MPPPSPNPRHPRRAPPRLAHSGRPPSHCATAKVNAFANSPENVQILANNGGKAHDCVVGLKQVPEKLWQKYEQESADWPAELRVGRTAFLTFFNQPGCFQILRAKSCLCGPCHEHGTLNFEAFYELVATLTPHWGEEVGKAIKFRAEKLHSYLAHEYRGRCALQSPVATQCITHALCGSCQEWGATCAHGEHDMSCAEDNERFELIEDVRMLIAALQEQRPAAHDADDWEAMLYMADEDLARFEQSLTLYVQHLLRKALSSSITSSALEALHSRPNRCHLIVDYKQKWLPVKHLETQSDSFGKRGKSIWGGCAIRWDATTQDYAVLNVRIACDYSKQNWYLPQPSLPSTALLPSTARHLPLMIAAAEPSLGTGTTRSRANAPTWRSSSSTGPSSTSARCSRTERATTRAPPS